MRKKFKLTNEMSSLKPKHKRSSWLFNSTWLLLLLMTVFMWQCEKDDFEEIPGKCPVVTSTDPTNGATGVSFSQIITAKFNEKMNPATFTKESFVIKNGSNLVSGTVSCIDSTASFKPSTALLPNTVYTGTFKELLIKDAMGNSLQTDYVWTFTTNLSPMVLSTIPLSDATDVDLDQVISATFSVPMDPSSLNMTTFSLKNGEIPIAGTISYIDASASFTPTRNLSPGTIYTATITTGVKSISGSPMESNYVWTFNTGGIPAITFTDPANLEEEVVINKTVTATFSEPMDPTTLNATTFTIKQGAVKVTGVITTDGTTVSFNPENDLKYGTTYTAIISKGAKNAKGKSMEADYVWIFTTNNLAPPTVIYTEPTNNEGDVPLNTNISVTFSDPMDLSTLNTSTFTLYQGSTQIPGTIISAGSTVVFNPDNDLTYYANYTATILAGVKNQQGVEMVGNYAWAFDTKAAIVPTITSTNPADDDTGVELDKNISATFSVPMDQSTFNSSTFKVRQGVNIIEGEITYNGTTVLFNPENNLSFGTTYIVTITNGVKNTEGTPIASNYIWTFITLDAPAPTVILTDPANNESGVVLDKVITATFSEPMDQYTLNNSTFILKQGSDFVSGTVNCSGFVATFTPSSNLLSGVTYTATLTTGVKNAFGANLANNYTWSFNSVDPLGPTAANLKTVGRFGIFAGVQIVNNTGATEVRNMDVGLSPGLRTDITGFPPGAVINGGIYASDDGASIDAMLIQAKLDMTDAYQYCEAITFPAPEILEFDIGGMILEPGLYKSESTMLIQMGNVILDAKGDVNAVWIFQIASGLNTIGGNGGNVILSNGAQAKNVFWQVGNSAVIGEGTTFNGTILSLNTISANISATINGRLLVRHNSVYVNTVIINKP